MTRWSDKLSKAHQVRRPTKYGNKRVEVDGKNFASGFEAQLYAQLKLEEKAGLIKDIRTQVKIYLTPTVKHNVDFVVFDIARGIDLAREAKGFEDLRFAVLKQLYKDLGPLPLQIYKKSGNRITMTEEIPAGKYQVCPK